MKKLFFLLLIGAVACTPEKKNDESGEKDDAPYQVPELILTPVSTGPDACIDMPLSLSFKTAPKLGAEGFVRVYDAAGVEVDSIDLSDRDNVTFREDGTAIPDETITNETVFNSFMDAIPSSKKFRVVHYTPFRINGKTLEIKLHSGRLEFGKTYSVTVDEGVVDGFKGVAKGEWTFKTKSAPSGTELGVDPLGTKDFCTIQGALTYASSLDAFTAVTINVAAGEYREMLYLRDKASVTVKGAGRDRTKIIYPNSELYETGTGGNVASRPELGKAIEKSGGRSIWLIDGSIDKLKLEALTIENSFGDPKGQAETIYFNSSNSLEINDCALISFQDTFQCKGKVTVKNSLIAGACDFIWGSPSKCLFDKCEIRSRATNADAYLVHARCAQDAVGFVFRDCRLTAEKDVIDGRVYLARSPGNASYWDNVTYINCTLSPRFSKAGWYTSPKPNPEVPTAINGWKEYGLVYEDGSAVTGHTTYAKVLTEEEAKAFIQ